MDPDRVDIVESLHVTPRLWGAAKLLYGDKWKEVAPWVRRQWSRV